MLAPKADLAVTKTGPASIYWGNAATYTVTVKNLGPDAATGVVVSDTATGGTISGAGCTVAAGTATCSVGNLAVGASATVTLSVATTVPGTISDTAPAAGDQADPHPANDSDSVSTDVLTHPTSIVYTGSTTSDYHDAAVLSAKLVDVVTGLPLSSKTVDFLLGAQSCSDGTNASGIASCSIVPNQPSGSYPLTASYSGSALFDASSDIGGAFVVTLEETTIVYTGVTGYVANGSTVTLSAKLREDGTTPIAGRIVTLTLGSQSCTDTTNASGVASCTIVVGQTTGAVTVTASFAGEAYYVPASDSDTAFVYSFAPGGGAFVVGNQSATGSVTFWGAQWAKVNSLSGGAASSSFKGYAKVPATPSCGVTWSTDPGNSTPPPAGPLPTFMAVLVTSSSTKSGAQISGNTTRIVLVKTAAGYDANPGHAGTGTVIAALC